MARAARSIHARKKRRKTLDQAKGYKGTKHTSYKRAKEQVWKSGVYAYEGRKQRKRDFRSLWIQRINAAARQNGLSYSQFMHGVRLAEIDLDRKVLADLAATEPAAFAAVAAKAKSSLGGSADQAPARSESSQASSGDAGDSVEVDVTGAAERKADEEDVDLAEIEGSGQQGRITVGDVEKAAKEQEGE